ncbi:MAG TPA: phosphatidylglycerophosphatase A [Polyangiaceae bacterium]
MNRAVSAVAWTLATWFGCGRVPKAPGTAGTVGAIPLYLLLARTGRAGVGLAAMVATFVGVWAASVVAKQLSAKDPQVVVIDEVAGFLVTMVPVRIVSWQAVLSGFVLFRLLDSLKPWPIRRAEKLPGGWGIVLDDVVAGVFGAAAMVGLHALKVFP